MNEKPFWVNPQTWACPKHFQLQHHHCSKGQCSVLGCSEVRPRKQVFRIKAENYRPAYPYAKPLCAWSKCTQDNGKIAFSRKNSKYCSDTCRKAKARYDYKQRQKLKK